jgi:hypothetical protein
MVTVPLLDSVAELTPTEYPPVPGPFPVAPELSAIQFGVAEAVHSHPAATVTERLPLPPSLPKAKDAGAMAKEQTGVGSFGVPNPAQPAAPAYRAETTTMASRTGARIRHLGSPS